MAVPVCPVGPDGVKVRNLNEEIRVFLGGPDVGTEGDAAGFPLEPGEVQDLAAPAPKESAIVPAPPGDLTMNVLYARTAYGTAKVSWISA